MSHQSVRLWMGFGGLLLTGLAGCGSSGPELGLVEGQVRLNGAPLPNVLVEFQPEANGSPSLGATDEDGRFQLRFTRDRWGAMLGRHTVKINHDSDRQDGAGGAVIPARYHVQSQLKRDVEPGTNLYEFDLVTEQVATRSRR